MKYLKGTFRPHTEKLGAKKIVWRIILCVFTLIIFSAVAFYSTLYVMINGECKQIRNEVVKKSYECKYTEWIPSLYMSEDEIADIVEVEK